MIRNPSPGGEFSTAYVHDPARLQALQDTELLDTPPEESFDRLTRLAAKLLGVPAALVSLVDEHRDFLKSVCDPEEPLATSRELVGRTLCRYAVSLSNSLVIPDTRTLPSLGDIPRVGSVGVGAYLGVPIRIDGHAIGAFCVLDVEPRAWSALDIEIVSELALSAQREIALRSAMRHAAGDRERYYRSLVENTSDLVSVIQVDGTMVYESPAAERVAGWSPEELVGRSVFQFLHPGDVGRVQEEFLSVARDPAQRVVTSYRFRDRDGEWRHLESTVANLLAEPAVGGIAVHSRDVTARREAEARISFQAQLLDAVGEAVIAVGLNGEILFWNRFAESLYGYSRDEALGKRLSELVRSDSGWDQTPEIMNSLGAGKVWSGEFLIKRPDGSVFPAQVVNAPILDESGALIGIVGTSSDLSQRKHLEEQLRQSQKMEAIGRLAGGIAHDFNNILTVIKGQCFMLLGSLAGVDPMRSDVEEIDRSADRAASLTRQLLAFSRKQVLRPQVIHPNRVVEGIEKMLHRVIGEDVHLVTRLDAGLDTVEVDPGQFEQVIMNLVVNARDAMPDGGVLIISTENRELRTSLKRSNYTIPAGRYVTISVRDTGHGIPEEIRGQIFEPFFTTKTVGQGTGLGLSTVYGIVKQSGGFIEIDNTAAMGVEFTVLLPASTPAVRSEPPVQQHARPARERKTLLLVEDEIAVRTMLTRILERAGFTVLSADGPAAALKLIEQQSRPVDLLLTDVVLREMGGPALAQSLQQRLPELKVVFMSGYTDEAIARQGVIHQGASLLEKPFTSDQLLETLKQALG